MIFERKKKGRAYNLLKVISHVYYLVRGCEIFLGTFLIFFFPCAKLFISTFIMDYKQIPTSLELSMLPLQAPESWNYRQQHEPPEPIRRLF